MVTAEGKRITTMVLSVHVPEWWTMLGLVGALKDHILLLLPTFKVFRTSRLWSGCQLFL